jgi:hypothetical protein
MVVTVALEFVTALGFRERLYSFPQHHKNEVARPVTFASTPDASKFKRYLQEHDAVKKQEVP